MDIIEGHPIPQDITGFQFRILGDMTIKQFVYLAVGLLSGWLLFSLPISWLIKIPLIGATAGTGIIFAFVPIQGRPADTMVLLFLKAVFKPNEYTFEKKQPKNPISFTNSPSLPLQPISSTQVKTSPSFMPVVSENKQSSPVKVDQVVDQLNHAVVEAKKEEQLLEQHTPTEKSSDDLAKQLQQALQEKQALQKQLQTLQQVQIPTPPQPTSSHGTSQPAAAVIMPTGPDAPNIVYGTIKDSRGNLLQNILVEVKDKQGNPVRAFKTNPKGEFASATSLLNGAYTLTFEDPKEQQKFAEVKITAEGKVLNPLTIISVDEREDLRKSLFGK